MKLGALRYFFLSRRLLTTGLGVVSLCAPLNAHAFELHWRMGGQIKSLLRWNPESPSRVAETTLRERNPANRQTATWKGVRLGALIEAGIEELAPEQRAHIDWLVIHSRDGHELLLPRWVATKYPLLLATHRDGVSIPLMSILPWTSRSQISQEELPIDAFFISGVDRIELMHAPERLGEVFLKRRTDPIALRGEKLFTKNCLACHAGTFEAPKPHRGLANNAIEFSLRAFLKYQEPRHGAGRSGPVLDQRALRALGRYAEAFSEETGGKDPLKVARTPNALLVFESELQRLHAMESRTGDPDRRGGLSTRSVQFVR